MAFGFTFLFIWWLLILWIGFATLPLTQRFLRFLPDRGYAFAKPFGVLLFVYIFWLLAALSFVQNTFGVLAGLLALLTLVNWGLWREGGEHSPLAWLRAHWRHVLLTEIVFTVAYLAFAFYRAYNPEITATEKPMEFMFLNSILASETFPPQDAWLAGFAISYYYLGYVMVAALAKLGGIPASYAFNLGLTMTFALAAVGAYGLVFNMIESARETFARAISRRMSYAFAILAIFLLLTIGNLEAVLEVTYNLGWGSREFYAALNLHGLEQVTPSGSFMPQDNWWWWRASRVINDKHPRDGGHVEVIDEFPAFSFLLGDLHPHVLALPYGLLALAVALNLLRAPRRRLTSFQDLFGSLLTPEMLLTTILVGALGMLNTWDIVTYGLLITAANALGQYRVEGKFSAWLIGSALAFAGVTFVGGYLLFLPFYLGFASQARGIAPELFNKTPLHSYLIMFGFLIFIIASFVGALVVQYGKDVRALLGEAVEWALPFLAVPVVIALGGMLLLAFNADLRNEIAATLGVSEEGISGVLLRRYSQELVSNPGVFLLVTALIALILSVGRRIFVQSAVETDRRPVYTVPDASLVLALLMAVIGLILTFGVEFLYIRDTFETRMNTVFKLYFQAWVLLAMAAAFGVFYLWQTWRGARRAVWLGAFGVLFGLSMIYPLLAVPSRTNGFKGDEAAGIPTLDGWRWVARYYPADYAAIEFLRANAAPGTVILEAPGPEYSFFNRVSAATGLPTILGWSGHEFQWRGTNQELTPRERDAEEIYHTTEIRRARQLLEKYRVEYVIVGELEQQKYGLNPLQINKFGRLGELVFNEGSMRIYRVE